MGRIRLPNSASLRAYGYAVVAEAALATASAAVAAAPSRLEVSVAHALAARLPKTHLSSVVCGRTGDLCEITAGSTLFYTDKSARFLVIGRVYDMKTRTDLTAARLLAINPDLLVNGAAHRDDLDEAPQIKPTAARAGAVPSAALLKALPANGAIAWGPANGPKVIVFSDFRCPYCARLSQTLVELGARVEERPISVLGTRALSEAVLCSASPEAAVHAAYTGNPPPLRDARAAKSCDTSGLDANEAFARASGFGGTPVLMRPDGAVIEGFRPAPVLAAWLKGGDPQAPGAGK